MSDVVSIELILDPATEERIRADWQRLADAGHSSLGAYRAPSNRPHITLLARPSLERVDVDEIAALLPLGLAFAGPITFPHGDRAVLARAVVLDDGLARLHGALHDAVPAGEDAAHTAPGEWTPHITLARRLRLASLDEALALLGPELPGFAVGLRRWDSATATVTELA